MVRKDQEFGFNMGVRGLEYVQGEESKQLDMKI